MEQSVCFMTVFNDSHFSRYELCLVQSEYSSQNVVNKSKYRVQHLPDQEGRWVVFLCSWWCRMIVTGVGGPGLARPEMLPDRFLSKLRSEE